MFTSMFTKPQWLNADTITIVVNMLVALGTFLAAYAALYIARNQSRERTKTEYEAARLTAAGIKYRLRLTLERIEIALTNVTHAQTCLPGKIDDAQTLDEPPTIDEETYQERRRKIQEAGDALRKFEYIPFAELQSMAPLPNHCAMKISVAQDLLRFAQNEIAWFFDCNEYALKEISALREARTALTEAHQFLIFAMNTCDSVSKEVRGSR